MNKALYLPVLIAVLLRFVACSSTKHLIGQTNAFYTVRLPGIVPVDEEGRALPAGADTINFVYVETALKDITWKEAVINGNRYFILARIIEAPTVVGRDKESLQEIRLMPSPPVFLWQLTFKPLGGSASPGSAKSFHLTGSIGRDTFTVPVTSRREIVLADLPQ